MAPSIRLGRIFGIEIGVNWSVIFVFGLVSWTLATSILPVDAPGRGAVTYWLVAIVGAVLFLACLLAHEMSHALVARRNGVKVAGITLWLFGGVSRLDGEPQSAGAEALIAGVGPLTSIVIAAIAFGIAWFTSDALLSSLVNYLWLVNLALGLFNLVPAFPLDGGRLLSALLWWRQGSRLRGVHNAVRVGRVFAFLMIAGGALELIFGAVANGIWIAFIGWFLLSAASSEEAGTAIQSLLRSVPVSAAMTSPVVTLPDWITVEQFLESVAPNHAFTTYPVHDPSGALTGVVRLADLVRIPQAQRANWHLIQSARPIPEVPTTTPREDLAEMIRRVGAALDQRVLVFDGGQLVGIVSPADIARVLTARQARAAGSRPAA
ncbi:MAG TPA: site-2 protease family protein [Candidatus Dormibacteraeota bacterium]|nr:site-2 protease family protein [Candidatus Dormibacteraeota bacterium]